MEAALFALMEGCPLIRCVDYSHSIREFIDPTLDLSPISFANEPKKLKTNHGFLDIGLHKQDILDDLLFRLSLLGLHFYGSIVIDDGKAFFSGKDGYKRLFEPNEIVIVNPEHVRGLENVEFQDTSYEFSDYTEVGIYTEYDLIFSGYKKYCQEIWFCAPFNESNGATYKDAVIVSFPEKEDLEDPEFSDHIMRTVCKDVLNKEKIRSGELKYALRDVFERHTYHCTDYDNIAFKPNLSTKEILNIPVAKSSQEFLKHYEQKSRR